jgi:hypothetical protein
MHPDTGTGTGVCVWEMGAMHFAGCCGWRLVSVSPARVVVVVCGLWFVVCGGGESGSRDGHGRLIVIAVKLSYM